MAALIVFLACFVDYRSVVAIGSPMRAIKDDPPSLPGLARQDGAEQSRVR